MTTALLCVIVAAWIAGGVAIVVGLGWLLRGDVRRSFPGGGGRYARALALQATAFIAPIPAAILATYPRWPSWAGFLLGVAIGYGAVQLLANLPWTKRLIADLARTRLKAALERLPPETGPRAGP